MKLSQIGKIEAKKFDFIDPYTNQPTGITVTLYPMNSKQGATAEHNMRVKIVDLIKDENNMILVGEEKQLKPELIMQVSLEMVAEMIVDWSGIEDEDDKPLPFTRENAIKQFQECNEFGEFVINKTKDFANFQKSKKKS